VIDWEELEFSWGLFYEDIFIVSDTKNQDVAIFKPYDEEPYTPNNQKGFVGELGS
jgi:hypothetical protein